MTERKHCYLCIYYLFSLFFLTQAVEVGNILLQSNFYQTRKPSGEYMFQFDQDEIFHVDLDKKETIWRLPLFGEVSSFEAAGALQNIGVLKYNLDIHMKRSNYTAAKNVAPEILIFTENPVILGEPNILICASTKFFPPVIEMKFLKNNQPVTEGTETDFYPGRDASFSKFIYLPFIPTKEDIYTCSVDHEGLLKNPSNKFWIPEVPSHNSESVENMVCGLGLAVGIIGIIAGIGMIFKGIKNSRRQGR
ncbi:HLA class II histocompatibility antigen, DR alpha chain-like [Discoglossus pictus]